MRICLDCRLEKDEGEFWKTRKSYCKECCKKHNREWSKRNPSAVKARTKRRAHDAIHKTKTSAYRKSRRRTDAAFRAKEISKNRRAKLKKYGITIEDLERMRAVQGNVCAICLEPATVKRLGRVRDLSVDHCHRTGKVRGLLCYHCNSALGHIGDSIINLWRAILYLRAHGRAWTDPPTRGNP